MLPFYRRPITAKTVLLVLLVPLVATSVPALLWLGWNARPLNIAREFDIQTPAVRSANAHELYEKAFKEFDARKSGKPVALIVDATADQNVDEDAKKYPLGGKKNWLAKNRAGFQLFDQALKAEYYFPPVRSAQPGGDIEVPLSLYWLARYASVECEVLAAAGQSEKAIHRGIDIWKMGLDGARGAPLTVSLQATKIEIYARRALDGEIAHLNGSQAARAARRLEKLLETRVSYETILREERSAMLFQTKPRMEKEVRDQQRDQRIEDAYERGESYSYPDSDYGTAPEVRGPIINWHVRRINHGYERGMKSVIANANAPWSRHVTSLPTDLDPKIAEFMSVLNKSRFHLARSQTLGNLVLARLALHAYLKDKGVYPPNLQTLAPKYLAKTPLDPFSDNQILRYRLTGKRYKLWSIGPDGRDDGARPALHPSPRKPSHRYNVAFDSTGDIVAQINK